MKTRKLQGLLLLCLACCVLGLKRLPGVDIRKLEKDLEAEAQKHHQGTELGWQKRDLGVYHAPDSDNRAYHVWSTRYKFFGCLVPKCGCSSWLKFIRMMHLPRTEAIDISKDKIQRYQRKPFPQYHLFFRYKLQQYEHGSPSAHHEIPYSVMEKQAAFVLNDPAYFKFAVARHPWTRIVSGYRSKYVKICREQRECLEKKFSFPPRPALRGQPMSFHEFVETLAGMDLRAINEHFRPFTLLCEFGKINYTYIGELDNNAEMDFLSLRIGANITLNNITKPQHHDPTQVRFPCTRRTVQLVEQLYSTDAYILGYNFTLAHEACEKHGFTSAPSVTTTDAHGATAHEEEDEEDEQEQPVAQGMNDAHVQAIEAVAHVDDDGREVGGEDDDSDKAR